VLTLKRKERLQLKTAKHQHMWGNTYLRIDCPHCKRQWVISYLDAPRQYMTAGPEWRCDQCMKTFRVKRRWFNARKTPRTTGDG